MYTKEENELDIAHQAITSLYYCLCMLMKFFDYQVRDSMRFIEVDLVEPEKQVVALADAYFFPYSPLYGFVCRKYLVPGCQQMVKPWENSVFLYRFLFSSGSLGDFFYTKKEAVWIFVV